MNEVIPQRPCLDIAGRHFSKGGFGLAYQAQAWLKSAL